MSKNQTPPSRKMTPRKISAKKVSMVPSPQNVSVQLERSHSGDSDALLNDGQLPRRSLSPEAAKRKWRLGTSMLSALTRMQCRSKERLSKQEKEQITEKYYEMSSTSGEILEFTAIRDLIFSCGQLLPEQDLWELLHSVGYRSGQLFTLTHFYNLMELRKKKYVDDKRCSDTQAAFAALRQPYETDLSIPALLSVCEEYALSEDVGRLIESADADESGRIDFDEFNELLHSSDDDDEADTIGLTKKLSGLSGSTREGNRLDNLGLIVPQPPGGLSKEMQELRREQSLIKSFRRVASKSSLARPQTKQEEVSDSPRQRTVSLSDTQRELTFSPEASVVCGKLVLTPDREASPFDEAESELSSRGWRDKEGRVAPGRGCSEHLYTNTKRMISQKRPMSTSRAFGGGSNRFGNPVPLEPLRPPKGSSRVRPLRPHRSEVPLPLSARHSASPSEALLLNASIHGDDRPASGKSSRFSRPGTGASRASKPSYATEGSPQKKRGMEFGSASQFNPFLGVPAKEMYEKTSIDHCLAIAPQSLADAASHHSVGNMYMRLICQKMVQEETKKKRRMARVEARRSQHPSSKSPKKSED